MYPRTRPTLFSTAPKNCVRYVFDVDGTTAGDKGILVKTAFAEAFKTKNLIVSEAIMLTKMGMRKRDHIADMLKEPEIYQHWLSQHPSSSSEQLQKFFNDDVDSILKEFNRIILEKYKELCHPIPTKMDTIKKLESCNLPPDKKSFVTAFNSGFNRCVLKPILENYPINTAISVASDEVAEGRPSPDMLLALMKNPAFSLHTENDKTHTPSWLVVVDDMPEGIKAGTNLQKHFKSPCFRVWDLTHSCLLTPSSPNESEDSEYLDAQRKLLIKKWVPDFIQPDFIMTRSDQLLLVDAEVKKRRLSGQQPGDTPTLIGEGNKLVSVSDFLGVRLRSAL